MKEIVSYESACTKLGIDSNKMIHVLEMDEVMRKYNIASYKLSIIRMAINGNWKPNDNDKKQKKWYPVFYKDKNGDFKFLAAYSGPKYACMYAGSNYTCETEEQAIYFGEVFIDLWNDLFK